MKQLHDLEIVRRLRKAGWLVTIKFMPKEFSFIIEGARSEYDAPSDDIKVGKSAVCVEAMMMREKEGESWYPQPTAINYRLDRALLNVWLQAKRLELRNRKYLMRVKVKQVTPGQFEVLKVSKPKRA